MAGRPKEPNKNPYLLHLFRSLVEKKLMGMTLNPANGGHLPDATIAKIAVNVKVEFGSDVSTIKEATNKDNPTEYSLNKIIESFPEWGYIDWKDFEDKESCQLSIEANNNKYLKEGYSCLEKKIQKYGRESMGLYRKE